MHKISILILAIIVTARAYEIPIPADQNSLFETNVDLSVKEEKPKINYRLPTDVIPKKYDIRLTPYIDENSDKNFTFDGMVKITIEVTKDIPTIVLHAKDLTLGEIELLQTNYDPVAPNENIKGTQDAITDFVKIEYERDRTFKIGTYILVINYVGKLNDDMRGFYRSSYINENNKKVWLATTHFEPVSARRAFPCFDEPSLKATFVIKIVHDKKYTALSNMPIDKIYDQNEKAMTTFKETPKMSTYLVAFVVSDFANVTNAEKDFTVFAKPNAISAQHGKLALEIGSKLLKALENFTQVKYEMGKMDQVAIPDFAAGAMENWGLVLYREKSLLFDDKVLTTNDKQNIVETIAHEFAHQWFGNLISPKWWKFVWLNEGFATFFQSYITDKVEPEWRSVEQSVVKSIQTTTFDFDSDSKTHPINHDVESPEEISALFDTISYKKAGAVIRMMQHFLTESIFQKGLGKYLKDQKLEHSAADSDDLFKAIQEVIEDATFKSKFIDIMNSWVNHKGYPVVKVTRDYESKSAAIQQERFFTYSPSEEEKNDPHTWHIPINYATNASLDFNNTAAQAWLSEKTAKIPINADPKDWIILNKQQTGYYRVNYDDKNWDLIINYLSSGKHDSIHVLNRAQLMNDALAFAKQKQLGLPTLLHLIDYLKSETDYIAWYPGFTTFSWLKSKLINTEHYSVFKEFASKRMKPLIESIGLEEVAGEEVEYLKKLNRATAIEWACTLQVPLNTSCSSKMEEKLKAWLENSEKNSISPDLKQVTLCNGLRTAAFETWEAALNKSISNNTNTNEKKELLSALSCSSDEKILEYYFNYTLKEKSPLENETITVVKNIYQNSEKGVDMALRFVINRLAALLMKTQINNVNAILTDVSKKITTPAQFKQLEGLEHTDIPESVRIAVIDMARQNVEWLKENEETIISTLNKLDNNGVGIFSASFALISSLLIVTFTTVN